MRREAPESARLYEAVGFRIRSARTSRRMTQEALASKILCARTTITNIERGFQAATLHQLWSIAHALSVEVAELIPTADELLEANADRKMIHGIDQRFSKVIERAPKTHELLHSLMTDTIEANND